MQPVGLDFASVLITARERGVNTALIADILPRIEAAIINASRDLDGAGEPEGDGHDDA